MTIAFEGQSVQSTGNSGLRVPLKRLCASDDGLGKGSQERLSTSNEAILYKKRALLRSIDVANQHISKASNHLPDLRLLLCHKQESWRVSREVLKQIEASSQSNPAVVTEPSL